MLRQVVTVVLLLVTFQAPQDVEAQDFQLFCEKAANPRNMEALVGCFLSKVPPKLIIIFDSCIKMQSNKGFNAFVKDACTKEKVLNAWKRCQQKKYEKEYQPTPADLKALDELNLCVGGVPT